MTNQRLDSAVEALRPQVLETLTRWLKIPSVKLERKEDAPFGEPLKAMLEMAMADAAALGFRTRNFDSYIGDAEMGEGEETMGILAHLDVVPAGDGWETDPFGAVTKDGKIYARGSSDDKGPAVAALFAMRAVLDAGFVPKKKVRLILGCDEESGWADIAHYKTKTQMPDFGFSPDSVFPVINTEKGILHLKLTAALADEEGAALPVYAIRAGERPNVIPGIAKAIIGCDDLDALNQKLQETGLDVAAKRLPDGRVELLSTGVPGHASTPHQGRNAAGQLLLALDKLGAGGGAKAFIHRLAVSIGLSYTGEGLGVDGSDTISGPLTLNLGILRVENGEATAVIDIRHPVLMSGEMIAKIIGMQVAGAGIRVEAIADKAPLHVPKESEIVSALLSVYHEVTGLEPYTIAIGGGSYARSMERCVGFGTTFPGMPDLAHQAGEYMEIECLMQSMQIFAHAIVKLAC